MNFSSLITYTSVAGAGAFAFGILSLSKRSIADWILATGIILLAAENACTGLTAGATSTETIIYWQRCRLLTHSLLPGIWLLFSLSYARGNAREFLAEWRVPLAGALILPLALAVLFRDNLAVALVEPASGAQWTIRLGWTGFVLNSFLLVGSVLILVNLERTFRASVGIMRWRIKFMLLGVGVLFTVRLYTSSQDLLFHGLDLPLQSLNSVSVLIAAPLMLVSLVRSGRFDLDVYPSQSVLQGSIAILLAGIYLLVVGVLAKVVSYLGGSAAFTLSAFLVLVSLVLLAILLQSDRVRLWLHRFVSRHFRRPIYDYQTMWLRFTEGTASRVEPSDLCRSLVRLVADMFQVLSVSLWLLDDDKETLRLVASTSLSESQNRDIGPKKTDTGEVIRHFQKNPAPADIEGSRSPWAAALRQWHPGEFPHGGHRVCIPLIGRGEMLGLITLGDRVGGAAYSLQDFDMLKCVGDHSAASLLNVQLSQKLVQTKELEAFQTMAAFFVHDLKNAASTLNLMLRNLPVHFNDPVFREDALRGISKTVDHINRLIGRLSLLRHELNIQPATEDLNEVVANALASLAVGPGQTLACDLHPVPRIMIDKEQMRKVITNLVLNATEALTGKGQVQVATSQANGWVALTVTDNGCGMSPEFINRSLFRPFQTTKTSGLGIGMFQSRMIIEAHRGRISVASEVGKGTTFQVFLPAPGTLNDSHHS
jgi:putative PEP-CTERM system histidine kinase